MTFVRLKTLNPCIAHSPVPSLSSSLFDCLLLSSLSVFSVSLSPLHLLQLGAVCRSCRRSGYPHHLE